MLAKSKGAAERTAERLSAGLSRLRAKEAAQREADRWPSELRAKEAAERGAARFAADLRLKEVTQRAELRVELIP